MFMSVCVSAQQANEPLWCQCTPASDRRPTRASCVCNHRGKSTWMQLFSFLDVLLRTCFIYLFTHTETLWQNFNLLLIVAIMGRALHLATNSYTEGILNKLKTKIIRYLKYNIDYSYYSPLKTLKTPQFIASLQSFHIYKQKTQSQK